MAETTETTAVVKRSCRWSVTGAGEPVRVFVFEVEGYAKPWFLVTTSATLTAAEVVSVFAARFRQEDGFRDHNSVWGWRSAVRGRRHRSSGRSWFRWWR